MKSQTKNSKNHTNGSRKSQQRKGGQRPPQQNTTQGKGSRAPVTRAPVAIGNRTFSSKPRYRNMGDSLVVAHNEYIGDIVGSSLPYAIMKTVVVNPGNQQSFPWLSMIASRYESYKFIKLNYRFLTERPTTEPGYIALVLDYDPSDAAPISKTAAFQYESTAKSAPWENVTFVSHQKNLNKRKSYFVRTNPNADLEELPVFDTGNLFVCAGGNSGAVTLGELWCDYEVVFDTPQLDLGDLTFVDSALAISGGTESPDDPLGTTPTLTLTGPTPAFVTLDDSSIMTFKGPYRGLVTYTANGTTITAANLASSTATVTAGSVTINAAGTTIQGKFVFMATAGQILDFRITSATISSMDVRFGRYSGA